MKVLQIISLALIFIIKLYPQTVSDWQNHSDKRNAVDIAFSKEYIWTATRGGGFGWNYNDSTYTNLTKIEGLQTILMTTVAVDNYGKVWYGSSNGIISVYDPASGNLKSILDIYNSGRSSKRINEMKALGDTIIVSTDFGVSLIDANNMFFYDTYFRFGDLTSYTQVNSALLKDIFYIGTQAGLAIQKSGSTNLSAPESWNIYRVQQGIPDNKINDIIFFNDMIICATPKGMAFFNGSMWESFLPQFNGNVTDLSVPGDGSLNEGFFFTHNNVIHQLHPDGNVTEFLHAPYTIYRIEFSQVHGHVIATSGGVIVGNLLNSYIYPSGPVSNQFNDLVVDNDGALWVATGADPAGVGTNRFYGNTWKNFNITTDPGMVSNALFSVHAGPDNKKYFGTWGRGVSVYDGNEFVNYGISNSGMVGIANAPDFLVVSGTGSDSRNNLWVLNYGSAENKNLSMMTPDNQWYHFRVQAESNLYLAEHFNLAIDNFDTKWYSVNASGRQGLYYFNEIKTYDNISDDKSGFITTEQGLTSNSIRSVVVDRRGDVWVGTSQGVTIISNTGSILSAGSPQLRFFSVFALRQQTVNAIAVDPLNNKWIGTNQGLLYVNSDGSALLAAYDSKNSPLLADEILSLTVDPGSGIVYAGSDAGLTSFKTVAVRPVDSFTELNIFPNPLRLNKGNNHITIEGLVRDSDIKILSVSGKVVYEFASPGGGIAYWDGKDFSGKHVNSGIYIIVASDAEGNNVVTGKVAVLKE